MGLSPDIDAGGRRNDDPAMPHSLIPDPASAVVIQPGPVFSFNGTTIGLDLRFGDPDDDGRAVEAIAEGFAALGCTLGGEGGAGIVSGGS